MSNIYGTVGYAFLKSNHFKNYILVLADVHSKLPYCDNKINISDWFYKNKTNSNILLEEVPINSITLKELWPESEHTQSLKKFFINNPDIVHAIDIRPLLIPFSWELNLINNNNNINLVEYIKLINDFFNVDLKIIKNNIINVYNKKYLNNSPLGNHFNDINIKYKNFINKNNVYLNLSINEIYNKQRHILEELNNLLDSIMEWFAIAKMFNFDNNKNMIIHTGLFHSHQIIIALIKYYFYNIESIDGINTITQIIENDNIDVGCINLPKVIENQLSIIQ
jgi:hypothetical protein